MKKLLISTALVASLGFASSAFAQEIVYEWTVTAGDPAVTTTYYGTLDQFNAVEGAVLVGTVAADETNSLAGNQESLLQSLLSQAESIQVSLANTSENLANIDGSISIDLSRFESEFDVTAGGDTGVLIMEPLNATIGQLTTTVIGSLGDGSVISTSVLSSVEDVNQAMTQTSDALNLQFAEGANNLGLQQVYNLSSNLGALDASVDVVMAGVNLDDLAGIATTAIGSLGTGAITSNVTNNAAGLTERLIGTN
jgi:hypothetical protein